MNLTIAEVIEILVQSAWRRRWIIIAPIVIFSLLAAVAVLAWPRSYVAQTLLMLQESGSGDPLMGGGGRRSRLKAEEIDTLLKSDRVLADALLDMNVGHKPLTARELEGDIKSLRKRLSVSVVGDEFIQIELKDSDRAGIGSRLSIILTRFFERLLARENTMKTAREFALEQRQRDVATTRVAIEDWIVRARSAGTQGGPNETELSELRQKEADLKAKVTAAAHALLPGTFNILNLEQIVGDELRLSSTRANTSEKLGDMSERIGELNDLDKLLSEYRSVGLEISSRVLDSARKMAHSLLRVKSGNEDGLGLLKREFTVLDTRYGEAVAQLTKHVKLARRGSGPSLTPLGLVAPDSIRIIDEPRDPETPSTSILKILVACLAAGLGIGGGVAALAEQLDDRIYDRRNLASLTGIEAVYCVPTIDLEPEAPSDGATPMMKDAESAAAPSRIASVRQWSAIERRRDEKLGRTA